MEFLHPKPNLQKYSYFNKNNVQYSIHFLLQLLLQVQCFIIYIPQVYIQLPTTKTGRLYSLILRIFFLFLQDTVRMKCHSMTLQYMKTCTVYGSNYTSKI